MKEVYAATLTLIIRYYLVALAFVTPLFFLAMTSEFYNFNKYVLLVGSAALLTVLWTGKMVLEGRVRVVRTPADVPVLILVAVSLLATIFSVDPFISIFGWYPRYHFSFLSILSYALIYFVAVSNLDTSSRRYLVWGAVAAGLVAGFLTSAAYFGQYLLPEAYTHVRNWTPLGSINQLVLYLLIALPLGLSLIAREENYIAKAAAGVAVFFMGLAFVAANIPLSWIVLAIVIAGFLFLSPKTRIEGQDRYLFGGLAAVFVILALIFTSSGLRNSIVKPAVKGNPSSLELPREVTLPLESGWKVSARSVGERPLLGAGPGTYLFTYTTGKPIEMNAGNNWNIRFDVPGNDYLHLLSTMGIIGTIAYLFVLLMLIRAPLSYVLRSSSGRANPEAVFLALSLVAFVAGVFFFDSGISTFLLFTLAASAVYSYLKEIGVAGVDDVDLRLVALRAGGIVQVEPTGRPKQNNLAFVVFIPALVLLAALVYVGWRSYAGEVFLRRSLNEANANRARETRDNLLAAIRANPYSDVYHRTLMLTDLSLARALSGRGNLGQAEQTTLVGLVAEAIDQGKIIAGYDARGLGVFNIKKVPGTSAANVANWESLALVYSNIGGQQRADASVHAKNTYSRAIQLDPLNPQLYEALGNLYLAEQDLDNAIKLFESAAQAKGDYAGAHYNLAQALQAKGGDDNIIRAANELATTLQILPADSPNREQVQAQFDELRAQAEKIQKKLQSSQSQPNQ